MGERGEREEREKERRERERRRRGEGGKGTEKKEIEGDIDERDIGGEKNGSQLPVSLLRFIHGFLRRR
jgi:hypothetical protein